MQKNDNCLNTMRLINQDELASYVLLDQYPLYDYKNANGDLELLVIGEGSFGKRFILSALSCGQMLGAKLKIHVVGETLDYLKELTNIAPALSEFSNISKPVENGYVVFSFAVLKNLEEQLQQLAEKYRSCRYVVSSLRRAAQSRELAGKWAVASSRFRTDEDLEQLIVYDSSGDFLGPWVDGISRSIRIIPFSAGNRAYEDSLNSLGRLTLRLNYLYEKLADPRASLTATAERLAGDTYAQRSSCASALHLKYKLTSLGIPVKHGRVASDTIEECLASISAKYGELIELEHRRWCMDMIANGYRFPSIDKIEAYSFRETASGFNASFKDTTQRLHNCLVPCGTGGLMLPKARDAWDRYTTYEEIDETEYDPLDKMSLKMHLLARKRIEDPTTGQQLINDLKQRLGVHIRSFATVSAEGEEGKTQDSLTTAYNNVMDAFLALLHAGQYNNEDEKLDILESAFAEHGIRAEVGFRKLREDLKVYAAFSRYQDFKAGDATIIDHLPWLVYAPENLTLIKLKGQTLLDDIAGPLLAEPDTLVLFGSTEDKNLERFFRGHGVEGQIRFAPRSACTLEETVQALDKVVRQATGRCVIDLTGADEVLVSAAMNLRQSGKQVALLRFRPETQGLENIAGFPEASIYRLHNVLSAEEVYSLFGAKEKPFKTSYMRSLLDLTDQMWTLYQEFRESWGAVTAFFAVRGAGSGALYLSFNPAAEAKCWRKYETHISQYHWEGLRVGSCFAKLQEAGMIRGLKAEQSRIPNDTITVSFEYRLEIEWEDRDKNKKDPVCGYLDTFFGTRLWYAWEPFVFKQEERAGKCIVFLESSSYVRVVEKKSDEFSYWQDDKETKYAYRKIIPALKRMEELGILHSLSIDCQEQEKPPITMEFFYANPAVRDCLIQRGNILELYAWKEAKKSGTFDDCRANLSFLWPEQDEDGVSNELDLILTKGLTTLVVSCKTAMFNKEHLYEVKYLTDRFSLNSKAIIVYSSLKAVGDDDKPTSNLSFVKRRAAAMGVHLIDLNKLPEGRTLGDEFVRIAEGRPN